MCGFLIRRTQLESHVYREEVALLTGCEGGFLFKRERQHSQIIRCFGSTRNHYMVADVGLCVFVISINQNLTHLKDGGSLKHCCGTPEPFVRAQREMINVNGAE